MFKDIDIDIEADALMTYLKQYDLESLNDIKDEIDDIIENECTGNRSYISYTAMDVDIDIDEDDIISELEYSSENELKNIYYSLIDLLDDDIDEMKSNLYDIQKEELCTEIKNKYNLQQIEDMIKIYQEHIQIKK